MMFKCGFISEELCAILLMCNADIATCVIAAPKFAELMAQDKQLVEVCALGVVH